MWDLAPAACPAMFDMPDRRESQLISVLDGLVEQLLPSFFGDGPRPDCRIISAENAAWSGTAECIRLPSAKRNSRGLKIRYHLPFVAIKRHMFSSSSFAEALSTYLHELAHVFGGDHTIGFSQALTEIIETLVKETESIEAAKQEWESICGAS